MVEPLRHRQTKEAETDLSDLQPPRHISTLPIAAMPNCQTKVWCWGGEPDKTRIAKATRMTPLYDRPCVASQI